MPVDPRFAESWVNRPYRILGRKLRPYCLDHLLNLDLINSPLAATSPAAAAKVTWADIFLAVAICSTPFESPLHLPSPRAARAKQWLLTKLHRLTRGRCGGTLSTVAAAFRVYQNDYHAAPDLFSTASGRELTAPALLARAVFMQRRLGMAEERLWTMPIGKLLWTYAATLEQESEGVSLLETREQDFFDLIKKQQDGIELSPREAALFARLEAELVPGGGAPSAEPKAKIDLAVFGADPA